MTRALAVAVAFAATAVSAQTTPSSDFIAQQVRLLRWLDTADVHADVQRHVIGEHDTRFVAVYGFVLVLPGTDDRRDAALIREHSYRAIEGTSDYILSSEHRRLIDKARDYARQYNSMLLSYLRTAKR